MSEEVKNAIRAAFDAGIAANQSEDEIKIAMIQAGSTFKAVAKEYQEFLVEAGLVASKEDKEKTIDEALGEFDVSTEEGFNDAVTFITTNLKGVDEKSAAGSIRYACRKAEKPCYVKPKAESTGRKSFVHKFYSALIANPNMTEAEAEAFILGTDGNEETSDNVQKHLSHYQNIRKLANAIAGKADFEEEGEEE